MRICRLMVSLLMCVMLTACSNDLSGSIEQNMTGNKHPEQKKMIFTYVTDNQGGLLEDVEEIGNWSDVYHYFVKDGEKIFAGKREQPYGKVEIVDDEVVDLFEDESFRMISFPVKDEIVVFEMAGLGIAPSSITLGFYYSPEDKPVWVDSEQLRHIANTTGEYLYYPMLEEGNGWIPDTSVLDLQKDNMLRGYGSYSERICDNFYYYESWY